ncbi:MAG: hypothetical protein ACOX5W_00240 [Bacillota bacterium]|jgi:hypothetical protein
MEGNVKRYLDSIGPSLPAEIISLETKRKIDKMAVLFSDFAASEYIMETNLNSAVAEADFSFRILTSEKDCLMKGFNSFSISGLATDATWMKVIDFVHFWPPDIPDIWLEMDYGEFAKDVPQPCFFFNATQIKEGTEINNDLLHSSLSRLLDSSQLATIWPNLTEIIHQLPPEVGLFQIGTMLARHQDRVRVFTAELTQEQTLAYLARINWPGDFPKLEQLFNLVHPHSDGQYIVDFDVTRQGISEKIGINFGLAKKQELPAFLANLTRHGLCNEVKQQGVLAWSGSKGCFLGPAYGFSALVKDISHFKMSLIPEESVMMKAYLRIMGIYLKELFTTRTAGKL